MEKLTKENTPSSPTTVPTLLVEAALYSQRSDLAALTTGGGRLTTPLPPAGWLPVAFQAHLGITQRPLESENLKCSSIGTMRCGFVGLGRKI